MCIVDAENARKVVKCSEISATATKFQAHIANLSQNFAQNCKQVLTDSKPCIL